MIRDAEHVVYELKRYLRKEMNDLADHSATGGCRSWDEYMKLTGVIQGLAACERKLLDLAEKENDDDGSAGNYGEDGSD
jgi:hypothetical protein